VRHYQSGSRAHQSCPRPDLLQVQLRLGTAMPHRAQQLGIDSAYRPERSALDAVRHVHKLLNIVAKLNRTMIGWVNYFDT
jgi:hypothetical protein